MTLAQTTVLDEQFAYADGALATVSSGVWATGNNSGNMGGTGTLTVTSGALVVTNKDASLYLPLVQDLGTNSYTISATLLASSVATLNTHFDFLYRGNGSALATAGEVLRITAGTVLWTSGYRTFAGVAEASDGIHPMPVITANTPFVFSMNVTGNVVTGYVDGTQVCQFTETNNTATSLVGLGVHTSQDASTTYKVTRFTITRDLQAPNAPGKPTGTYNSATEGVDLTWAAPGAGDALTSYNIYRGSVLIGSSATAAFSDPTPPYGTTPTYQISAVNSAGESAKGTASDAVTVPALTNDSALAALSMMGLIV